jgi:hypothetical protein
MISIFNMFLCIELFCNQLLSVWNPVYIYFTFYVWLVPLNWSILHWHFLHPVVLWLVLLPVHGSVGIWNKYNTMQYNTMEGVRDSVAIFLAAWVHSPNNYLTYKFQSWRWKQHVPLKHLYPPTRLNSFKTQKTTISNYTLIWKYL